MKIRDRIIKIFSKDNMETKEIMLSKEKITKEISKIGSTKIMLRTKIIEDNSVRQKEISRIRMELRTSLLFI